MREQLEKSVSGGSLRLALREMQADMASLKTRALLAGAVVILGLSGPFGTYESLSPAARFLYWGINVPLSSLTANFAGTLTGIWLSRRGVNRYAALPATGLAAGLGAGLAVSCVQALVFGLYGDPFRTLAIIFASCLVIGMTITAILASFRHQTARDDKETWPAPSASGTALPPPLLRRLPLEKRGKLVSLTVRDHYVEVTTLKGKALLLMRLGDAIDEAGPTDGLQLHRSHWVARDAIRAVRRIDGRIEVETLADERLPVSRSHAPRLREAGLLP